MKSGGFDELREKYINKLCTERQLEKYIKFEIIK